ncbi:MULTISPECIES: ParA family protein [unclassified Mesorhizobium]|uniref:ParA family protein n=1 Tax=unclassified Mesorhizobium TaxID=325217 RepID=UPI001FDEEA2A|nr:MULTISPECIES: ParA family protein [unclassified Mesorhizobium]
MDDELVGINEIAEMANTSKQAVANWRVRISDFPKPIAVLASGPVFRRSQVRSWLRRRKVPMAHVFSTINLKGGVGKTTTTVAVAETLAAGFGKRVLVIDLDPQTNATTMLIGEERWRELNDAGHTLARLFKDALEPDNKQFDFDSALQQHVSDVSGAYGLDLLPSSLDLIDVQDRLASTPSGKFYSVNPIELLWRAVKARLDDYDIVIVDCPPNLGIITLNGLRISHGYIIPTIPDILSTYGIPQIVTRVKEFSDEIAETIEPLGIVVTKFQSNSSVHANVLRNLRAGTDAPVFDTIIAQANDIAAAAEHQQYSRTLKQKYGYRGLADAYWSLAKEILARLEG